VFKSVMKNLKLNFVKLQVYFINYTEYDQLNKLSSHKQDKHVFLLIFSLTDIETLDFLSEIVEKISFLCPKVPFIIAG
jgi:hypothetical protein